MSSGPDPCPGGEGRSARPRAAADAARQDRTSFDAWYGAVGGAGPAYARTVEAAFGAGQWSGQQGLCTADEILDLGRALGVGPNARLLDACCGIGGPATRIAAGLGCEVVGLDRSLTALAQAAARPAPGVRLVLGEATRLPFGEGSFEAALVLDSMASVLDPAALLRELGRVLAAGGRLGCTLEVGEPLNWAELARIERGVEASVLPLEQWLELLGRTGFRVLRADDETPRRASTAGRLVAGLVRERAELRRELGAGAVANLIRTLSAWAEFLERGRLRAITLLAERRAAGPTPGL